MRALLNSWLYVLSVIELSGDRLDVHLQAGDEHRGEQVAHRVERDAFEAPTRLTARRIEVDGKASRPGAV